MQVDAMLASYPRVDRQQVQLAYQFHRIMTEHFGTEDYDPDEALRIAHTLPKQEISGPIVAAINEPCIIPHDPTPKEQDGQATDSEAGPSE